MQFVSRARLCFLCAAAASLLVTGTPERRVQFQDVTAASGIDFTLRNSATPQRHQIETMPGGVAIFDYDNDGELDVFFTNGAAIQNLSKTGPEYFNRLYRNKGNLKFEDVTGSAGVRGEGYSMGAAAGDFNNDGFADLFIAGVNRNILYRNNGDGTFRDITGQAGLSAKGSKPWSIAAGWFDYDQDGNLDLFVVNYVVWAHDKDPACGEGVRTYCHPKLYQGLPNQLYRNNGDGTFTDVSKASGIGAHIGKGMGLAFADFDEDGDLDVFVANDTVPNFLFRNDGNGRFTEVALRAGVAFNDDGRALSSMGVDFRDLDNDGRPDLFVTALANETYPFYRNLGEGLFEDATYPSRLGRATIALSGWGAGAFDFNNDGLKDLFAANGDVNDNTEMYSSRKSRQSSTVFVNLGKRAFSDGEPVTPPAMYRGAAFGDLDGDGRIDVVVSRLNEPALVLRNNSPGERHWLGLRLTGTKSNHDAIGAGIRVVTASGAAQWNHVTTSVGYASSSDRAVHFGLGGEDRVNLIEIRWPSGVVQILKDVAADRYLAVSEP